MSHGETSQPSASDLIDRRIADLADWRGAVLAHVRALIHDALPDVVETWKWRGTPVWEQDGIVCTGESYKAVVKLTFAKGASLPDPAKLFNASLDGGVRRAIDLRDGEVLDADAFRALVRAAAAANSSHRDTKSKTKPKTEARTKTKTMIEDATAGPGAASSGPTARDSR